MPSSRAVVAVVVASLIALASASDAATAASGPRITSFSPAGGAVGTLVTISGSGLSGTTLMRFGGDVGVAPTAVTATSVKAVVPDGATTGALGVTNDAGSTMMAGTFRVRPAITGLDPAMVPAGSATIVTVTGTTLSALTGAPTLKVGSLTIPVALIVATSPTAIQFRVPVGAASGKIGVTTVDGTAVSATILTMIQPPKPTRVTPAAAAIGASIRITGANLGGTTVVTFGGGVTTPPASVAPAAVTAVVPDGAVTGSVSVTNPAGTAATRGFRVQPRIMDVSPPSVVAGRDTAVTLSGTSLVALTGTPAVKVGALTLPPASVLSVSPTTVTFRVPATAQSGRVSLTTVDGTALSATPLEVIRVPRPTAIAPVAGGVDTEVTITGANLSGITEILFGANASATPTLVTATRVKARVPAGAQSGFVSVFNAAGGAPVLTSFTVLPKITGFSPESAAAGDQVTISGYNFGVGVGVGDEGPIAPPSVKVGSVSASIVSASPGELTVIVPRRARTSKIRVTNAAGTASSVTDLVVTTPSVPDLEISSIEAPFQVLRSTPQKPQTFAITTTVTNQGPGAAGPFGIALILDPVNVPGFFVPVVIGMRKVSALASGAVSTGTTIVKLPVDVAPGLWTVRAEPDWNNDLTELTERERKNNLAFLPFVEVFEVADGPYRVEFTTDLVSCAPLPSGMMLTGTATFHQFLEFGFSPQFSFDGTLAGNGVVARLTDGFGFFDSSGTVLGNVTLRLMKEDGSAFRAAGGFSGGIFEGELFASFTFFSNPDCSVDASLTFTPSARRALTFDFFAIAGALEPDSLVPLPQFPVVTRSWMPVFTTVYDTPEDPAVTFLGPSGFVSSVPSLDFIEFGTIQIAYRGAPVSEGDGPPEPPAGTWQVLEKGREYSFVVASAQSATRTVVPVPTFSTQEDGSTRLTWTYRTRAGATIAGSPSFIRSVAVTLAGAEGFELYGSGRQSSDNRRITIPADVPLNCVGAVIFAYEDTSGNTYHIIYGASVGGCPSSIGSLFVRSALMTRETRAGTSTVRNLGVTFEPAAGLVESATIDGGPFSATPLPYGGPGHFRFATVDRFDLDYDVPVGTPYPPRGTPFSVNATLRSGHVQPFEARLDNTPTDGPVMFTGFAASTFDIAMVRGVARLYTWSLDAVDFDVSATVLTGVARNARGEVCLVDPIQSFPAVTEAALTVPPVCVGRLTTAAEICVFVSGDAGQISSSCRSYDNPPGAAGLSAAGPDDAGAAHRELLRLVTEMARRRGAGR